jgi:RNA polymerase sigma-70 factor, ECF subfamily
MDELSDDELVARYRADPKSAGGQSAIEHLFHRHQARVAVWCYKLTNDVNSAADLAQDVFLKAFQRLDSFRGESKFTTWLYTIARHQRTDQLRSHTASAEYGATELPEALPDLRTEDISDRLERREADDLIRKLMRESLDETESQVMTLHYVREMSLDAVTRLLALKNQSGAKAYVVSARRKLARAIATWKAREVRGTSNV